MSEIYEGYNTVRNKAYSNSAIKLREQICYYSESLLYYQRCLLNQTIRLI